jgi:predicted small secreted protein
MEERLTRELAHCVLLPGLLVATSAGCQTVAGLGKDVEKLGGKIELKAKT